MIERRRWPRHEVAWAAWLLIGEGAAIAAKVVDVSLHGLRVAVEGLLPGTILRPGEKCRVEIRLADNQARFFREGEVRHIGEHAIAFAIVEPIPAVLVPSVSNARGGHPAAVAPMPNARRAAVASSWRAAALALARRL